MSYAHHQPGDPVFDRHARAAIRGSKRSKAWLSVRGWSVGQLPEYLHKSAKVSRKNPTKKQKREKARKASVQRRVAVALAKFLKQANPAMKTAGASVTRLKGGGFTIRPIKANAGKGRVTIRSGPRDPRYGKGKLYAIFVDGQYMGNANTKAEANRRASELRQRR